MLRRTRRAAGSQAWLAPMMGPAALTMGQLHSPWGSGTHHGTLSVACSISKTNPDCALGQAVATFSWPFVPSRPNPNPTPDPTPNFSWPSVPLRTNTTLTLREIRSPGSVRRVMQGERCTESDAGTRLGYSEPTAFVLTNHHANAGGPMPLGIPVSSVHEGTWLST